MMFCSRFPNDDGSTHDCNISDWILFFLQDHITMMLKGVGGIFLTVNQQEINDSIILQLILHVLNQLYRSPTPVT